ncbi:MAG: helix-turn-helix domain-containing protein [Gammaproteobacteria bacterium]|nr:helix-turn-helix domain-containing protein [Gammaproteobacteria bacterium]
MREKTENTKQEKNDPVYLDTRRAADLLGLSPRTLDRYRVTGEGPEFFRFGNRIRYLKSDVLDWARVRRLRSTSDSFQLQ